MCVLTWWITARVCAGYGFFAARVCADGFNYSTCVCWLWFAVARVYAGYGLL